MQEQDTPSAMETPPSGSPNIRAVAAAAGVSTGTVSRALRNMPGLSEETRARILEVAAAMGYDTGKLRVRRLRRITLLLNRQHMALFQNPFYSLILQGMEEACKKANLALSYTTVGLGDSLDSVWDLHDPDGIVCAGFMEDDLLERISKRGIPVVLLDYSWPGIESVNPDNVTGAFLATENLILAGYKRIAYLYGNLAHTSIRLRMRGYLAALYKHGIPANPDLEAELTLPGEYVEEATKATQRLLALPERPDAIFACSDVAAMAAIATLRQAGLSVPGDIGVVGFDDIPSAASHMPTLSTIQVDKAALASIAVERLFAISQGAEAAHPILPVTFIRRGSF